MSGAWSVPTSAGGWLPVSPGTATCNAAGKRMVSSDSILLGGGPARGAASPASAPAPAPPPPTSARP
eukprot:9608399-Alexandrium_andersonii.AAC.1